MLLGIGGVLVVGIIPSQSDSHDPTSFVGSSIRVFGVLFPIHVAELCVVGMNLLFYPSSAVVRAATQISNIEYINEYK